MFFFLLAGRGAAGSDPWPQDSGARGMFQFRAISGLSCAGCAGAGGMRVVGRGAGGRTVVLE